MHWWRMALAALVAGQAMVFSIAVNLDPVHGVERQWIHGGLAAAAAVVFALVGVPLVRESLRQWKARRWVVEQFFLVGIAGAFAASVHSSLTGVGAVYYDVVAVLVAIYSLGRLVGRRQRDMALASVTALRSEFERCQRLTCCGKVEEVAVAEIRSGDRVRVAAGAGVPVDGRVAEGTALVSETPLTGEAFPVVKRPGDMVWAGSHALDAVLVVEAVQGAGARRLDTLIAEVESARTRPTGLQREADRIVAWFLPVVLILAALATVAWGMVAGWTTGLFHGLAVLVVACPCAMGLATPIAVWSAMNRMVRRGLVPHGGEFLERLAQVDTVVFDKTGTLTEEHLQVVDWKEADGFERAELEAQVAAVQGGVEHPVARAFRHFSAAGRAWTAGPVTFLPGRGISARVEAGGAGHVLEIGNEDLVPEGERAAWEALGAGLHAPGTGARRVVVRRDGRLAAAACLRESLRPAAGGVLDALRGFGLQVGVMSGDRPEHVEFLGVPGARGGMTAEEKAAEVRRLQASGRRVLFVGDGINDAPAMACAHASVAMGSGAPLSREASGAQLFGGGLEPLVDAVALARATVRRIRQNLGIAAVYNTVGIGLAMSGLLHPVLAALLMLASSFTVSVRALGASAGEGAAAAVRSVLRRRAWVPWVAGGMAVAALVQGAVLVHLAALGPWAAAGVLLIFALAAVWLWNRRAVWVLQPYRVSFAGMLVLGNLGMLLGWWADAGFAQLVRDGACPCCSAEGSGFSTPGLMLWGMLLGSMPSVFWEQRHAPGGAGWRWVGCLALMGLGMSAGAWLVRGWVTAGPQAMILMTFGGMMAGMVVAMLAWCGPRLLQRPTEFLRP